ncbi:hypothetical protein FRC07_011871, partial [Ceratobasidium sp. 392]
VLDEAFDNLPHELCYTNGNCNLCVARRARDLAANEEDARFADRTAKREEIEFIMETGQEEEPKQKQTRVNGRTGDNFRRFQTHLIAWRDERFLVESETCYIGLEDIMTDKALDSIAKCETVVDVDLLEDLRPPWPQRRCWGEEVVEIIKNLLKEVEEERRRTEAKKEREKELLKADAKKAKEEKKRLEVIAQNARKEAAQEMARREQESRQEAAVEAQQRANVVESQANAAAMRQKVYIPSHHAPPQRPAINVWLQPGRPPFLVHHPRPVNSSIAGPSNKRATKLLYNPTASLSLIRLGQGVGSGFGRALASEEGWRAREMEMAARAAIVSQERPQIDLPIHYPAQLHPLQPPQTPQRSAAN